MKYSDVSSDQYTWLTELVSKKSVRLSNLHTIKIKERQWYIDGSKTRFAWALPETLQNACNSAGITLSVLLDKPPITTEEEEESGMFNERMLAEREAAMVAAMEMM